MLLKMIAENCAVIRKTIEDAAKRCHRDPKGIRLLCVTKARRVNEIREAIGCGISDIGENRVKEAKEKFGSLKDAGVKWHMVGHLQTNKVRDAVKQFDLIHSVDSLKIAEEIDKQAAKINKVQEIFLEINTSGEESKYGIRPGELLFIVNDIMKLKNIRLSGLMTMAPFSKDPEKARPFFRKLRELKDEIGELRIKHLSMGMSQDYEAAVEEGATIVRVGTAIFEA